MELGYISPDSLSEALQTQKIERGKRHLGDILIDNRAIEESTMVELLSIQMGFPYLEPEFIDLDRELFAKVPYKMYMQQEYIPVSMSGEKVLVAFSDPLNKSLIESVKNTFKKDIEIAITQKDSIDYAIQKMIRLENKAKKSLDMDDESIIGIVNTIIIKGIQQKASDIHIEPLEDRFRVRFRIDGIMQHIKDYSKDILPPIVSRIKILTGLDITEKKAASRRTY